MSILAHRGYKLIKTSKKRKIVNQEYELSKIIRELEIKKDDNGNIIDTRFSNYIQERIRVFLKEKKINFKDTGYISLKQALYSLNFEDKKALCNIINNELGNQIDIETRLKKYKNSFFKKNFGVVSTTVGYGLDLANNINDIPLLRNVVSTILTAAGVTVATQNIENGLVAAGTKTALEAASTFFNVGEDIIESINSTINAVGFASIFAVLGITGSIGMSIINYFKGKKQRNIIKNELTKIKEIDNKLYQQENEKEVKEIKRLALEEPDLAYSMVISLVCEFMLKKKIPIPNTITNAKELVEYINSLNKNDKKEVMNFYEEMIYYNKHHHSEFVKRSLEVCETLGKIAIYGLASVSLIDLFTQGNFLADIKNANKEPKMTVVEPIKYKYAFNKPIYVNYFDVDTQMLQKMSVQEIENMSNNELYWHLTNLVGGHGIYGDTLYTYTPITKEEYCSKLSENFKNIFGSLSEEGQTSFIDFYNKLNSDVVMFQDEYGTYEASRIMENQRIGELLKDFLGYETKKNSLINTIGDITTSIETIAVATDEITNYNNKKTSNNAKSNHFTKRNSYDELMNDLENIPVNSLEEKNTFRR